MDWILTSGKRFFNPSESETVKSSQKKKHDGHAEVELSKEDQTTLKDLFAMFRAATPRDAWILTIGILFTIIHGAIYPMMAILIGSISETFIAQSRQGELYSNSTVILNSTIGNTKNSATSDNPFALIVDMFEYVGNIFGLSSTTTTIMTNEEFAECANTFSWYFVGFALVVFISTYIQTWCWESTADHQASIIRENFVHQMLRQELTWYESNSAGLLMAKLTDDLERFRHGIGHKFSVFVEYLSSFVIGAFFGFCINARLTLVFGLSVPFIMGKILYLVRLSAAKAVNRQEKYGEGASVCEDVISEVRTVAAFGREKKEFDRYKEILDENAQRARYDYIIIGLGTGVLFLIIYGSFGLGVLQASHQLLEKHISRKQVYTVFCCATVAIIALSNILPCIGDIAYAKGCSQNIQRVTSNKPRIDPYNNGGIRPHKFTGNIKFMNVMFSYPSRPASLVLRDFNLTVIPGVPVAILGASGSGKSTITDLLFRFYDPLSGSITFDDFELKHLNLEWVRNNVAILNATPTFLNDTIYHNITCRKDFRKEDVYLASNKAGAVSGIMGLPNKYQTVIGSGSRELSAILKQQIALARVLLHKPKVIILDEGLSSQHIMDEAQQMQHLTWETGDSALITVSHHVSRVQFSGFVIHVLKGGKIVEVGNHAELMKKKGVYYEMAVSQNAEQPSFFGSLPLSHKHFTNDPGFKSIQHSFDVAMTKINKPKGKFEGDNADVQEDYAVTLNYPFLKTFIEEMITKLISRADIFVGIFGCIISGVVPPIGGLIFCQLLITFSETGEELSTDAAFWSKALLVIGITAGLGHWMRSAVINSIGVIWSGYLRETVYTTTIRQAIVWFDDKIHSPQRLYHMLSRHPPVFKMAVGERLGMVISTIVSYITAIVISFVIEWRLALVIVAIIPVQLFILVKETKIYENAHRQILDEMDGAYSIAAEAVKYIKTIQSLSLQTTTLEEFTNKSVGFERFLNNMSQHIGIAFGIFEALSFLTLAAILRVGGFLVQFGSVEPMEIFKILIVMVFSTTTIGQVASFIPDYVKAKLAYVYLSTFGTTESTFDGLEEYGETKYISGHVTFKDVHFTYGKRIIFQTVPNGVNLDLKPGSFVGICGMQGKTTLLSLLLRFYECDRGQVLIDGIDVRKYKLSYLRSNIGYVEQNPGLLNLSIWDNIVSGYNGDLVGKELETLVEKTVELLQLTEFIDRLPEGYDTIAGRQGLTNSERQRIAIARAVIRNPKILILDMPTSELDPKLEMSVANALKKIAVGRTCIIVSNHPKVIELTDYVAVIFAGRVMTYGTLEELKRYNGAWYSQFQKGII